MAEVNVRYAGLAQGVDSTAPAFYLDASEVGMDSPSETEIIVPSSIGMTPRAKRPGAYMPSGNLVNNTDIRSIGWTLKWGLHGYQATEEIVAGQPTGFWNHEIWADDIRYLDLFNVWIGKDEFEHIFKGCAINSFEFSVERELIPLTMEIPSLTESSGPVRDIETIYEVLYEEYALAYYDVSIKSGANLVDESPFSMSLSGQVQNNIDQERGVTIGSRFGRRLPSGERSVSLSSEMHFEDMRHKERFWGEVGATGPTAKGAMEFPVEVKVNSAPYGEMTMLYPRTFYNSVGTPYSGREEISQSVEYGVLTGEAEKLDGSTVRTPLYVRLKNKQPDMNLPVGP